MGKKTHRRHIVHRIVRWTLRAFAAVLLVVFTLLLVDAFDARGFADLQPWQQSPPKGDFRARDYKPDLTFDDYKRREDALFNELDAYYVTGDRKKEFSPHIRYVADGPSDPRKFTQNWNRSFELVSEKIRGGVLLLHGLTDSPYSMRTVAEAFYNQGYYALALRLPGHGTVPAALLSTVWKDWAAAAKIGAAHVRKKIGDTDPFCIAGYSNGGALSMLYTLASIDDETLRTPDRVFLFSPAIGVTPLARASNWHKIVSWIPYFEKDQWLSVDPEYDPYKYVSFPKNAGRQTWALSKVVQRQLDKLHAAGRLKKIPPILTFQSVVDATIVEHDLISRLYQRLEPNGSELVIFDINNIRYLDGFYKRTPRAGLDQLARDDSLPFRYTLITNASNDSPAMVARSKPPNSTEFQDEPLNLVWPDHVYSLAHVAIPFSPHDPIYGDGQAQDAHKHLQLGQLFLQGEKHVLAIPADQLTRLRHNPFHSYMLQRITEWIDSEPKD